MIVIATYPYTLALHKQWHPEHSATEQIQLEIEDNERLSPFDLISTLDNQNIWKQVGYLVLRREVLATGPTFIDVLLAQIKGTKKMHTGMKLIVSDLNILR